MGRAMDKQRVWVGVSIGDHHQEHKKTTFPYVEPTVQLPDEIEDTHIQLMITGGKMTYLAKMTNSLH